MSDKDLEKNAKKMQDSYKRNVVHKILETEPELTTERKMKIFKEYLGYFPNKDMFDETKT